MISVMIPVLSEGKTLKNSLLFYSQTWLSEAYLFLVAGTIKVMIELQSEKQVYEKD